MTIDESLYLYKKQKLAVGISYDTVTRVLTNVTMFVSDMSICRIKSITTNKILDWGEQKRVSGVKSSTLSTYYNSIRSYITFVKMQGIDVDVHISSIRCKARYGRRRALSPADIRKIMSYASPQVSVLINFMYMTGLRVAEAVSITEDNLTGTTIYIYGKGGKQRPVFIDEDMLRKLTYMANKHNGIVFTDYGGEQLTRKKAYYHIKKYMVEAGFPWASPHILRHSFATELLKNGASLAHTSRLMGHSSTSVTEIYTHLLIEDIEEAHKLLTPA